MRYKKINKRERSVFLNVPQRTIGPLWFPQTKLPKAMTLQYGETLQSPFCRKSTTSVWKSTCFQILLPTWQWKLIYGVETQYLIQISPGRRSLNWWTWLTFFACLWNHCCGILPIMSLFLFNYRYFFRVPLFSVFNQYNFFALQRIIPEAIRCAYRSRWVSLIELYSYTSAYQS